MSSNCTLSITVARTDVTFMMQTIPHLVKSCQFSFDKSILFVDASPLKPALRDRPHVGTLEQLRNCCKKLVDNGIVDDCIDIDFSDKTRKKTYQKHFGKDIKRTFDFRGSSVFNYIFSIDSEELDTDYIVHFDSDILLYQQSDYNWIEEGIELLNENQDIICVLPLSGPPTEDGSLKQREVLYNQDDRGFYSFKNFTSRVFLLNRQRFDSFLPLKTTKLPLKGRIRKFINTKDIKALNDVTTWEAMVSHQLNSSNYIRADICSPKAWTLHPTDRSSDFIKALPQIIQKIETGWYPLEQAGKFDLELQKWL